MIAYETYEAAAELIRKRAPGKDPDILMVLGSGLGFLGDRAEDAVAIDYGDIPGFRVSTAPGHKGRLILGTLAGRRVAVMQGRMHCYEGYSMEEAAFPIRVAKLLGAGSVLLTNAAGAINKAFSVGDIMVIRDHIKLCAESPLRGENQARFGPRFNDMTETYSARLAIRAEAAAEKAGVTLRQGVYMYFMGPQFETPAEIRAAAMLGADAAGMSTVPEAIVARHCGMEILGFSLMTNMAAGISDVPLSGDDVIEAAEKAKHGFSKLVLDCLEEM
ncbi:purine-nucleoside phosphorylase [Oscillospiraceae bacterium OttesenSCG-928-F05]|nr:purine-nucleoside phosphorylase [Oscillospiraceae bacterium OttesenSCG-928-F05]